VKVARNRAGHLIEIDEACGTEEDLYTCTECKALVYVRANGDRAFVHYPFRETNCSLRVEWQAYPSGEFNGRVTKSWAKRVSRNLLELFKPYTGGYRFVDDPSFLYAENEIDGMTLTTLALVHNHRFEYDLEAGSIFLDDVVASNVIRLVFRAEFLELIRAIVRDEYRNQRNDYVWTPCAGVALTGAILSHFKAIHWESASARLFPPVVLDLPRPVAPSVIVLNERGDWVTESGVERTVWHSRPVKVLAPVEYVRTHTIRTATVWRKNKRVHHEFARVTHGTHHQLPVERIGDTYYVNLVGSLEADRSVAIYCGERIHESTRLVILSSIPLVVPSDWITRTERRRTWDL
jgi:hypothetical protein